VSYALYTAAFGAAASAATSDPVYVAGVNALRQHGCYSQALDDCVKAKSATVLPGCAQIRAAYDKYESAFQSEVDKTPYCSEPERTPWTTFVAVGAFALAAGMLLGRGAT